MKEIINKYSNEKFIHFAFLQSMALSIIIAVLANFNYASEAGEAASGWVVFFLPLVIVVLCFAPFIGWILSLINIKCKSRIIKFILILPAIAILITSIVFQKYNISEFYTITAIFYILHSIFLNMICINILKKAK